MKTRTLEKAEALNRAPVPAIPSRSSREPKTKRLSARVSGVAVSGQAATVNVGTVPQAPAAQTTTAFGTLLKVTLGIASAQGVASTLVHFYGSKGTWTDFRACVGSVSFLVMVLSASALLLYLPVVTLFVGLPLSIQARRKRWFCYTLLLVAFQLGLAFFQAMQVGALIH